MKKSLRMALVAIALSSTFTVTALGSTSPRVKVNGESLFVNPFTLMDQGRTIMPIEAIEKGLGVKINIPNNQRGDITFMSVKEVAKQMDATINFDKKTNTINFAYKPTQSNLDAYGHKIRTTNLPKNANMYPYILECIPNEMYEMPMQWQLGKWTVQPKEGKHYIKPINIKKDKWATKENIDKWIDVVEKNLELRLNVDYRTVDSTWVEDLIKTYGGTYFEGKKSEVYYPECKEDINKYINYIKKNKISVRGNYYVEPSIIYLTNGGFYIRTWVTFNIKSDVAKAVKLYDSSEKTLKPNTYYEGYVDVGLGTNVMNSNGSDLGIFFDYIAELGSVKERTRR